MEGTTYQQQITTNLNELRERLWSLCCLAHADVALTASREALGAARAMQVMVGREGGSVVPGDRIPPPAPGPQRRKQQRRPR